jgi:hypothetical protein
MTGRIDVMVGDLIRPPSRLAPGSYHHVMLNPPYLENGRATASPIHGKALANIESTARLGDWLRIERKAIGLGVKALKFQQVLRADRVELPGDEINRDAIAAVALVLIDRHADQPTVRNKVLERNRLGRHTGRGHEIPAAARCECGRRRHRPREDPPTHRHLLDPLGPDC